MLGRGSMDLAQDGAEKDGGEPVMILLVFRLIK